MVRLPRPGPNAYRGRVRVPPMPSVLCVVLGLSVAAQQDPPSAAGPGDQAGLLARANRIERHGITWQFEQDYVIGAFANGDPWVLGPVRVIDITPRCVETEGRVRNGSMVDPDPKTMQQGYDSALFGDEKRERYDAARNVAFGLSGERPLVLQPGQSLVSVGSRSDAKLIPNLQTAAVLTCLDVPPAPDAFRPPYVRGDKNLRFRVVDIDWAKLRRVRPVADMPPIASVTPGLQRLWLDHFPEWPVRYAQPLDNMPDYGRDLAALVGSAALVLQTDVPNEKKRDLLVSLLQIGIDSHAVLRGGGRWRGIGGHGSGRKLPILLAGLILHDEAMLAIGKDFRSEPTDQGGTGGFFAEDSQTFFVRETAPGVWNGGHGGYTGAHDGLAEWGFSHADTPSNDTAAWEGNPYRRCCSANGWVGHALVARMLGLRDAWNHPAFFDYMDRYMKAPHTEAWHRAWVGWQAAMWDAYRANY